MKKMDMESLTTHFEKHFTSLSSKRVEFFPTTCLVTDCTAVTVLSKYNLIINEYKMEGCAYSNIKPRVKKLGMLFDETAEINKRTQLAGFALYKYRKIWKNLILSTRHKIAIYIVYVKSILMYNCSTWVANKSTNDQLDRCFPQKTAQTMPEYTLSQNYKEWRSL